MTTAPVRVLLVEDSPSDADLLQESLRDAAAGPLEVTWVERLDEALARNSDDPHDVLLLDLSLPDSAGPETYRRALHGAPDLPIVVLTGDIDEGVGLQAVREGVYDYLIKGQTDARQIARTIRYALQRRESERALRESEARLAGFVGSAMDAIVAVDEAHNVVLFNPAAEEMFGCPAGEALGGTLSRFIPERVRDVHDSHIRSFARDGTTSRRMGALGTMRGLRANGEEVPVEASISHTVIGGRELRTVILRDVTERTRWEQALQESEARFRSLFSGMTEGFALHEILCDGDGEPCDYRYLDVNPAFERATGLRRDDIVGKTYSEVRPDEERCRLREYGEVALTGRPARFEEQTTSPKRFYEVFVYCPGPRQFATLVMDITERRRLEQRLMQAEKMEALGQLAGGIAHEFNNLLMIIMGYAENVDDSLDPASPLRAATRNIQHAVQRGANLTRQVLGFARREFAPRSLVDLNELVRDMNAMLRPLVGEHIELTTRLRAPQATVKADPHQLEHILMNLASNARDAMTGGGSLEIATETVSIDDPDIWDGVSTVPGTYVLLTVRDTGTGMTEEVRSRAFEPFFTTKDVGRGTGLGLSNCYGSVKQNGGYVWIDSTPGGGTTIRVYLPYAGEPTPQHGVDETSADPLRGSGTILVVEDDELVRGLAVHALRSHGYTVIEAANGLDALQAVQEHPGSVDLLATDVVMPRMGGEELVRRLRTQRPEIPVLYIAGHADVSLDSEQAPAVTTLLQKPFTWRAFLSTVRELMSAGA